MHDRVSPFLTVKEASKEFHIGINRLYAAIHAGELRAYRPNSKTYLLNPKEITEWIYRNPVIK